MSLLSRSARSALAVRRAAAVPTQAARFESTDASSSSAAKPAADKKSDKKVPAKQPAKKREVSFEDRELERKLNLKERVRKQSELERTTLRPDQQKSYNAPYAVYPKRNPWDINKLPEFKWDEPSSAGFLRIQQIEEMRSLMSKAELDRPALQAQAEAHPFKLPKGQIRVQRTIDLSDPESPLQQKAVVIAPVSALPLEGADALRRFKVLAGPRWTPGWPGRMELEQAAEGVGAEGYVKISEETYATMRMNRKSASDMLERLVAAANDANSPLPKDVQADPRYMLMRAKKRNGGARDRGLTIEALKRNPHRVGGVKGFPLEWLTPKMQEKALAEQTKQTQKQ
ncbi:hypothetical protein A1Q1_04798 [Trichosporon asahii var. asahii CBS 2479]|uniref:Small ribosomal subunit protein mS35 mitochondrial conserved domain-containing protein n=1 Tax=Trichosporon asahii var. asahii (strain ATCC 90039 / CBS 2479 / JCM 2466 / KCTC 7840 / NBRC 103889/ NCYC 2677 / UAMH 7654) TaxID=1186058 RepID=J5SNH5_TRIAS|nr:hypothetical protein A1Q1_04798 [Trichosporon asahii var. asahii CBS 2479]EJT46621.1 hypothetical protein A1Q1_04798 [Trichosporon asahii var. asahii CBS 2479]